MAQNKQNEKTMGKDLTQGPILPLLVSFAIPMVLASVIQQLYSMVDLMVIGRYVGSVGTVAVSTGGELSDLMTPLASGFSMAGQIYIAQLIGAGDREKTKSVVQTLFTLMIIVSVSVAVIACLFSTTFLNLLNCPEEAFAEASSYLRVTALGMPFIFGYNAICAVLRGMGESKRPMYFILVAATINIFLDLLFVCVFRWDAFGTALATVASQIGSCVAAFLYLYKRREQVGMEIKWSYLKMDLQDLKILFKLGVPQMVRTFCVQGSMLWVKSNINSYGLVASATYSVGNKIEKFMNLFIQGVDGAGGAMIGQNLGARKPERVRETMRRMLMISLTIGCLGTVLFLTIPKPLYSIFTTDAEVIDYGVTFLRIMSVGCLVVAFSGVMKSISTGAGVAWLSLVLGVMDGVCRILVCLLFVYVFQQGVVSYFWGAALCQLVPGLIAMTYYLSGKWQTRKLLSEQ